ncbi:LOW QUALITY PROTEIN: transcription factor CP2-like protein 1 [Moschus berezovskii]|uniref:LOW QUALITY PROTEIN: transcription factor CP2-like protein 1 n=1 Tax=Moschus berezovskii TaxID=68408 RepID=UPI00244380CB|nr:LOW QUALITY PROTEIN: transcription factor CP2-like protein 1 [Moschus berezovskii]
MLFWHNQPEHLWPSPGERYSGPPSSLLREALPLPYLKQEELANIPRVEQPCPTFQYVLCAATSTAVKQQEEALTYLNQGQSYELRMLCNPKLVDLVPKCPGALLCPQSVVHVVFHDWHLQFTEQQQLDEWRWSRPGDRILDIDIPLSVGVLEPQVLPSQLDTVEFYWDLTKKTSLFLQVHCISTEFTPRKKGGEKGVPFRLQIDTFKPSDKELPLEHLHSAGCLVKVFKGNSDVSLSPKRADWKLKTDREKIQKQPTHERNKHQTASESTVFMEILSPERPIRHRLTFYVAQEASRQDDEVPKNPDSGFYQEISLDELSAVELLGKLAELLAVPANQIHRLFHQGPRGILILLSDQGGPKELDSGALEKHEWQVQHRLL